MPQLILVLEENLEIQRLITSCFKDSEISVINETNPEMFLRRVNDQKPDLIFLSNFDSDQDYKVCRKIRGNHSFDKIPIILLLNAKDKFDDNLLSELKINGILRKPFEASALREHLGKYITLDENFGNGPVEDDEDFKIDMSEIDNQLQEIRYPKLDSESSIEEGQKIETLEKSSSKNEFRSLSVNEMDTMILEDISEDTNQNENDFKVEKLENEESGKTFEVLDNSSNEKIEVQQGEIKDDEIDMESDFEMDLKLDENDVESIPSREKSSVDGLEKLKISGLEDQFAESRLQNKKEENGQDSEDELEEIDLEVNDFEEQPETWERPPDLDLYHQTPREGLTDISLEDSDFQPEFPKNLSSFGDDTGSSIEESDITYDDMSEIIDEMDSIKLEEDSIEKLQEESSQDNVLLDDTSQSENIELEESDEYEKLDLDTRNEIEETFDSDGDVEIKSMVEDSFTVQEEIGENDLEDLEDLSSQMEALESDEEELKSEEEEFESTKESFEREDLETRESVLDIDEDVFDSWDEAEDAFLSFDRKSIEEKIISDEYEDDKKFETGGSFTFTEEELKEIVSSSVQTALEKSIASSLVELAVSELKTKVNQMNQDWA